MVVALWHDGCKMLWPMRSICGLPVEWIFLAIGAAAGCSTSIIDPAPPRSDAGSDCEAGAGAAKDGAAGTLAAAAIVYPSPSLAGTYLLALGNGGISCANPTPAQTCAFGVSYEVELQLPPQDLSPGVYPLSSLAYPSYIATGPAPEFVSCCWGGGGDFVEGSLHVLSVSSAGLAFQLQDTPTADFDVNDSTFTAQLCPGVPGSVTPADSATP